MADKKTFLSTAVQNPLSIALVIFTIVIALIWMDYRSILKEQTSVVSSNSAGSAAGGFKLSPPDLARAGAQQPKIMDTLGEGNPGAAPELSGLITGLEEKVKADPNNVGKRILLAQTYKELGMVDKSIASLRQLRKEFPKHERVKLVTASVLSHRPDTKELKEALDLLESLTQSKNEEIHQYLVQMYQGDALVRLKDTDNALKKWNSALQSMPNQDNRYQILEKKIADLKQKQSEGSAPDQQPKKKG